MAAFLLPISRVFSRTLQIRKEVDVHIRSARLILDKIGHTFSMACARSNLREAINDLDVQFQSEMQKDNAEVGEHGYSAGARNTILRHSFNDRDFASPRARYLRRRAAICLQRYTRGRAVRSLFHDISWAVMYLHGSLEPPRLVDCVEFRLECHC